MQELFSVYVHTAPSFPDYPPDHLFYGRRLPSAQLITVPPATTTLASTPPPPPFSFSPACMHRRLALTDLVICTLVRNSHCSREDEGFSCTVEYVLHQLRPHRIQAGCATFVSLSSSSCCRRWGGANTL